MDKDLWEELSITLIELNKAIENVNIMYKTAQSVGLFDLLKGSGGSSASILQLLKGIDIGQITALLQSPLVSKIISDPEFYQLFMPDTTAQEQANNENHPPF